MSFSGLIKRNVFWTLDRIKGNKIGYFYNDLKMVLSDFDRGVQIQQKHLEDILNYAVRNTAFYQKFEQDGKIKLTDLPVVNKAILTEHAAEISVDPELIPGQEGDVFIQRTSGSTGAPYRIPQDTRKRNRRIAELKYYNAELGVLSHEKIGQCRTWKLWGYKSKWQIFKENIIPIDVTIMDDERLEEVFNTIKKEKCVLLRAYASWYDAIVRFMEEGKGNPDDLKSLTACISSSEALNEQTRSKMKQLTGVPIVEAYADEEAGVLGQQRINDNNYYLNHSGYVFEFLKLDSDEPAPAGELSRIVITDLFNYAHPLLRYDTGDTAIWHKGNDTSNGWPYIEKIYGRRIDLVYDCNGKPIHPMNIVNLINRIPGTIQGQFVQIGSKEYVIKVNSEASDSEIASSLYNFYDFLGKDATITIKRVSDIPVLASGKRKSVVCEWMKTL